MNTIGQTLNRAVVMTVIGVLFVFSAGCVSSSSYRAVKKEAEDAQRELRIERTKMAAIEKFHAERRKQTDELVNKLGLAVDKLDSTTRYWGELRHEIARLRIARELERAKVLDKPSSMSLVLETEPRAPEARQGTPLNPLVTPSESKQRIKELIQQLQGIVEQN